MGQNHISALAAPKTWKLNRKKNKWAVRTNPGPHPLKKSLPLTIAIKDLLGYAETAKEVNKILNDQQVRIDKKVRREYNYGIGLMDVIDIDKLNESYRVLYNQDGTLGLFKIKSNDSNLKILKVIKKTMLKKGRLQLTFHDGRNCIQKDTKLMVGDGIVFDIDKKNILKELKLERNSLVLLTGGKHIGKTAVVKEIIKAKNLEKAKVVITVDGSDYITLMDYAFTLGKNKPEVNLGENNE